ncbi:MAG: radical SAM protein [Candidatus Zambryskibacteria bacterium]
MRVLLIRPYFEMLRHELVFLPFEPLGLEYLKSALLTENHRVEIYDCLTEHPQNIRHLKEKNLFRCGSEEKDIVKKIKDFEPDVVGISGMFYSQASSFYRIADLVKKINPRIFVVGGGAFPSAYKEKTLMENKNIDTIVIGEGEETMVELLKKINNPREIKGICFIDPKSREIVCNEPRIINMSIDKIIFPYRNFSKIYDYSKPIGYNYSDKFNLSKLVKSFILYSALSVPVLRFCFSKIFNLRHKNKIKSLLMPHGFIITSRSCPNRCGFCAIHKVWGSVYRMRSAQNVLDEIGLLVEHGIKEIVVVDDNFTVSKKRTIEICKEIVRRKYNIRLLTPSGIFIPSLDREVLEHLYEAGLKELKFGIENGDQEFLNKVIRKNVNLEQAKKIIKEAKEIGFYTQAFLIFGYPGETKDTMLKTLRFAFESGVDSARFYIFQPFPGTQAFEATIKMGNHNTNFDLGRLKAMTDVPQVETKDFTKNDVKKIYDLAYRTLEKGNYNDIKDRLKEILKWQ